LNGFSATGKGVSLPAVSQAPDFVAVTGSLPLGGSSTFLLNLTLARRAAGLSTDVIVLSEEPPFATDLRSAGATVTSLSEPNAIYEDRLSQGYELLAARQPRAVLSTLSAESFELLRLAPPGVARIGMIQSHDPGPYRMVRRYADCLDAIVGVSAEICRSLRSEPVFARTRVELIHYGIQFPEGSSRPPRSPGAPLRVCYVGRFVEEQKRVSRLARLAKRLEARKVAHHFTIAGEGPEESSLRTALEGRRDVLLRGPVPYREVSQFFAEQDVFVLLSDYEGLPLTLLEAMGAGAVPVVSDLVSGMREVVDPSRGFLVAVDDIEAAAEAIATLGLNNDLLTTLSGAATTYVRTQFSAKEMSAGFQQLFCELETEASIWPPKAIVPAPRGVRAPWAFRGAARVVRRLLRKVRFRSRT
jgi:glycosyltransferase involved in cell wall biosynthesis